jgi:putative acetyltransferase
MEPNGIHIRESTLSDTAAICAMVERAFGGAAEAELVAALLDDSVATLSLVAEENGVIVGHVLLSGLEGSGSAMALAPLAVEPGRQKKGIGSALVRAALAEARQRGRCAIFVLGDPGYYGRFGFRSDLAEGADVPWRGPAFMAIELVPGALEGFKGKLVYAAPFAAL